MAVERLSRVGVVLYPSESNVLGVGGKFEREI